MHLKSMPRDHSFNKLFGANEQHPYLENAREHPFDFQAVDFRLVNAWWLAEMSMLVYVRDEAFARRVLADAGLTLAHYHQPRDASAKYLVAGNDDYVVVAFRGTDVGDSQDIVTDLKIALVPAGKSGRVHKGFKAALDSVWPELNSQLLGLSHGASVWFAGHSLGGALATLAAERFHGVRGVYTFGSPRVGDKTFRNHYQANAYRFRNNSDLVTRIPLRGIYTHVGAVRYIDHGGRVHSRFGFWKRLRDRFFGRRAHLRKVLSAWKSGSLDQIPFAELVDHAPICYVVRVWNAYAHGANNGR